MKKKPTLTAEALDAMCREPVEFEFSLNSGDAVQLQARYLTPEEDRRITKIIQSVPPKMIEVRPGERVPDTSDPDYLERLNEARIQARALTLYLCVPVLAEGKPGLTDLAQITEYVQNRWHESILEGIYNGIAAGPVSLADRINFMSPRAGRRS